MSNVYVSKEEAQKRLSICNNCIHYIKGKNNEINRCSLCGCKMPDKVHYKGVRCADDKLVRWQ